MIDRHLPRVVPMPSNVAETCVASPGANRRLYHRYTAGLEGELTMHDGVLPCRIGDISLGGASIDLLRDARSLLRGTCCVLGSTGLADGYPLPAEVRNVIDKR
jgi:hypothetical protein